MLDPISPLAPNRRLQNTIVIVSVLIPIVVAVLLYLPETARVGDLNVRFLPHLNAVLNSATALCLFVSLIAILNGKVHVHKTANLVALFLSAIFLTSYVIYHYSAKSAVYGDADGDHVLSAAERLAVGGTRAAYVVLLLSHIALATVIVPFVLFSFYYSLSGQFEKHKRLSRYTWPMWFYVSVTGVIVYWMIAPYYRFG